MSVKQVIVESPDFPPLSPNGEYLLRYRIVSEDKNRTSHWSPIYKVDVSNFIDPVSGDVQISNSSLVINATWEASPLSSSYDIFVSFGIYNVGTATIAWDSYAYQGSSRSTSYSFLRPTAVTDIRVKIQLSGVEKVLSPSLEIYSIEKTRR